MANLSVCIFFIPNSVKTTSGVSSSVYPLTTMVTSYLPLVLTKGSVTRWTEDGQSSLVGSIENLACQGMSHAGLPVSHNLSSGLYLWAFSLGSSFYQDVLCGFTHSTYRA